MATDNPISNDGPSFPKYKAVGFIHLNDVSRLLADKVEVSSPTFTCEDDPLRASFRMILGFGTKEENKMAITLKATSRAVRLLRPSVGIHIHDEKMRRLSSFNMLFDDSGMGLTWNGHNFPLTADQQVLRIVFDVNYAHEIPDTIYHLSLSLEEDPLINANFLYLRRNMATLLANSVDADFTICVGDEKLKCHKVVLVARSSYFRGLFQSGMRESQSNSVTLDDASPVLYRQLLQFLYTAHLDVAELSFDLLQLAEKYAVDDLKTACVNAIYPKVNADNVIETIILADQHNSEDLLTHCLPIFKKSMDELKSKEGWQALRKLPDLLERLLLRCNEEECLPWDDLYIDEVSCDAEDYLAILQLRYSLRLGFDLEQMLDADEILDPSSSSDVTIHLEDGSGVQAHKCILRVRCPPLVSALESHSVKSYQLDGNPRLVKALIKYLYSGMPPANLEFIAMELLPVAERFQVADLVRLCILSLRRILSAETVVDILIQSQVYDAEDLFDYCLPVYKANALLLKEDCKKKLEGHPKLLLKLAEGCST